MAVHMCNSRLDPICGETKRESGSNGWSMVNCPACIALAADSPQVRRLQDMLQGWPADPAAAVPEAQDGRECVFCAKARDERWRRTVESFEPLNPVTPGHRLFVPREHVTDAAENHVLTGVVFEAAARYAESRGEAFNLITSAGVAATQSVWHLHVHYVPRRDDDGLTLPWTGQAASAAVREGERERLAASPEQEVARQAVLSDPVAMGEDMDELRTLWRAALEREGNLASAVADVIWKATQYGETEAGDTYAYIVPKGCMHRLVGVAQSNGAHVPVAFRAALASLAAPEGTGE